MLINDGSLLAIYKDTNCLSHASSLLTHKKDIHLSRLKGQMCFINFFILLVPRFDSDLLRYAMHQSLFVTLEEASIQSVLQGICFERPMSLRSR